MKSKSIFFDRDSVKRACEELAEMGLLQNTGKKRKGQVVWELSQLGKLFAERLLENKKPH